MHSSLLVEYLRTGTIRPLKKTDTMREVEAKLGAPEDWAGKRRAFGVPLTEPLITDFHDSWAWSYNSFGMTFPHPNTYGLPGISLDYGQMGEPIIFPPPFEQLPQKRFTLGELLELFRVHNISFNDNRQNRDFHTPLIVSEGAVAVATLHCNCSPDAEVISLYSYEYTNV